MKYSVMFCILLWTVCSELNAQTYMVLKVSPKNAAKVNGKPIKVGTKLSKSSKITFSQKEAYLRVSDGKKSATIQKSGILANVLEPARTVAKHKVAASRLVISSKMDLEHFIETPNLLIIDQMSIPVPERVFKLSVWDETSDPESEFFFISYQYQGEEVNKYLKVEQGNRFVLEESIYQVSGKMVDTTQIRDIKLRHAIDAYTDYIAGSNLSLRFVKTTDIKDEITALLEGTKERDKDILQELVQTHLIQYYGNPETQVLKKWLAQHFPNRF